MRNLFFTAAVLVPALLRGQAVVLTPAPPLWVNPADPWNYGVSIGFGYSGLPQYGIDLNGDGTTDFTLTCAWRDLVFNIVQAGSNAVLAYVVDDFGSSYVANVGLGAVVGPSSSLWPTWQPASGGLIPPIISGLYSEGAYGLFAGTTGYIGLRFDIDGSDHYGFLQLDCRGYSGDGGFLQGYGYNTVPGEPITIVSVPEPATWALFGLGALLLAALGHHRRDTPIIHRLPSPEDLSARCSIVNPLGLCKRLPCRPGPAGCALAAALLAPVLLHGQGVVLTPAPPLWVNPADPWNYGVSIGPGYSGLPQYGIDLNGDGAADFTLTCAWRDGVFNIVQAGNNAVVAYVVDDFGSSYVANLENGAVVGPSSSLSPVGSPPAEG